MSAQTQMVGTERTERKEAGAARNSEAVGAARLRSFVDRIERLSEEKDSLAAECRDIYAEAKGAAYDAKALRKLIALRRVELEQRREQSELLQLYMHAMGMEV